MKRMKRYLAVIMSAVMVCLSCIPAFAHAQSVGDVTFATMAGISYVAPSNRGGYCDAFLLDAKSNNYQYEQLDGLLESSFAALKNKVENENLKYLLINGDITYNGEYSNHAAFAEMLEQLEAETGVQVITLIGGKDVNNASSSSFASGEKKYVVPASARQIKTIYENLGYDIAANVYSSYSQTSANLSYSVELDGNYRLIVIDATYFSYQNGVNTVTGMVSDELLEWIKTECTIARYAGQEVIGMCYWDITGKSLGDNSGVLSNADDVAQALADAGMHYIYTAGSGKNDISAVITDDGKVIYDIMTAGLVSYPNTFRVSSFSGGIGTFNVVDADEVEPIVSRTGEIYTQPYRETASLKIQYADYDLARYFTNIITNYLNSTLIPGVQSSGSLETFVNAYYGISLKDTINEAIGGGLNLFDVVVIFDATNIMNLLEDMFEQAQTGILSDADALADIIYKRLYSLFNTNISSVACTQFLDTYGFGNKSTGGSLNNFILSLIVYSTYGNEDSSDDAFVNDVIYNLQQGDLVTFLANLIGDVVIEDFLFGDILSTIQFKPQYLMFFDDTENSFGSYLQTIFKMYISLHGESDSITGLLNSILKDGILKNYVSGSSVGELVDGLVEYYYSDDDAESTGEQLAAIVSSYASDEDPQVKGDFDVTYDGDKVYFAVASKSNYRLPSMMTITPGGDTSSEAYVTWYTNATVTGSDIEIYSDKNSTFFGQHFIGVEDVAVDVATEEIERTYYMLDLGFVSVGANTVKLLKHTMKITGLEAGCTYFFRVGDSDKGWWSETASITTDEAIDRVSFIHISDTLGDTKADFDVANKVIAAAMSSQLYSDADFILHTGNYVNDTSDLNKWQLFLDGSASKLLSTYIVPVAGSTDTVDTIKNNFAVSSLLNDSEQSGVYYSFDYGNAHIVVLDSNDVTSDGELSKEQLEWLKNDMLNCTSEWKIFALYSPVYTNGESSQNDNYSAYMTQIASLADTYNVDLVLSGNDGVYCRTDGMYGGKVTDSPKVSLAHSETGVYYKTITNAAGTVYSALGSSGVNSELDSDIYNVSDKFEQSGKNVNSDLPMFTGVEIIEDTLYLTTYTLNASTNTLTKVDSVAVKKGSTELKGDVNFDKEVTAADARLALRSSAQLELLTAEQLSAADVDGNGEVTAADARTILRISAGLE
ncbi:MAG: fibronectin type III domain-containing protein [Clostridia bacterium]|nr:fibronectin type III domain-containing protein [Clostridia bacterium]